MEGAPLRLQLLNWVASALHAGLAISAIAATADKGAVTVPVFSYEAEWNATACARHGADVPVCPASGAASKVGEVNFSAVLITSQLITAGFHAMQALQARSPSSTYITWALNRGIKIFHWLEYVLTASLIAHTVLYFSGMLSLRAQALGYAAQSTLVLLGLLQDVLRYAVVRGILESGVCRALIVVCFVVGFYNVLSVWGPSLAALFGEPDRGEVAPPSFVKWLVLAECVLYTSFGISQMLFFTPFLAYGASARRRYYYEEVTLLVLSFAAKATLATAFSACLVYRQCGR